MGFTSGTYSRTNGTETGANTWADARDSGDNILAVDHDTHDEDIATALSTCLLKDGTQTVTANLPMAGFKHTNVGDATSRTDYAKVSQVQDGAYNWGTDAGAADAYVVTMTPALAAEVGGAVIRFLPANTNTGASTINVSGIGVNGLEKGTGAALAAGDVVQNSICEAVYDDNAGSWIVLNPQGAKATADIADDAVDETKIGDLSDNIVFDTAGKGVKLTVTTGISAAGSTQGDATAITGLVNEVSSVSSGQGVVLPAVSAFVGMTVYIFNSHATESALVYPVSGEGIVGSSVDAAISVAAGTGVAFTGIQTGSGSNWGKVA